MLFLTRFVIGLWIVLFSTFLFLLFETAPNVPIYAPFAQIAIQSPSSSVISPENSIYLPNFTFTCTETGTEFQCKTSIQGRSLAINLTKGTENKYFGTTCNATYGAKQIICKNIGGNYAPITSDTYRIEDLALTSEQLQNVKQKYWAANLLIGSGEGALIPISTAFALTIGILTACSIIFLNNRWSKSSAGLACGIGIGSATTVLISMYLLFNLLNLGWID